ncbi:hypothetical protein ACLB2K_011526 [Fragaria x ananassa]
MKFPQMPSDEGVDLGFVPHRPHPQQRNTPSSTELKFLSRFQVLLVLGAAGGVGLAAVQIGKVVGAVVIAVARFLP